ncbi:MAG: MMPL family transporter [Ilumatobacteraceae bacterium]
MSKILYKWGRSAARHPWRMLFAWLVVVIAVVGLKGSIGGNVSDNFKIPGTEAQRGLDLLNARFPSQGGSSGQVVFADPNGNVTDATAKATIAKTLAEIAKDHHVVAIDDPFDPVNGAVSADGRIAYATVHYSVSPPTKADGQAAKNAVESARHAGLQAELSRNIVRTVDQAEGKEGIGLIVAVIVLLVAFGSVIAAGIPIGTALFGIFIGLSIIGIMAGLTDVPSVSPMLATMIGLGVGIDYALFVVTRHRSFLSEGRSVVESVGLANATAGSAVMFAGTTVVIAIASLRIAGIPAIATMGYASAVTVLVAMLAAVTLLPAFLGLAGKRIDSLHVGRKRATVVNSHQTVAGRWADHVGRHPWRYAIVSFVGLAALAGPVVAMRTGMADDGSAATTTTYRRAYDMLAQGFGAGFNGPLTIVVDGHNGVAEAGHIRGAIAATSGVVRANEPIVNKAGDTAVIIAYPVTSPQDSKTESLVHTLRDDVLPPAMAGTGARVFVTGQTAAFIDISERLSARLPLFIGAVVGLSFLLLMTVFRSVLVPLKAAVMNLLSIGAAYGVVVAVFQWGWGSSVLGLDQSVPISPFLPMIMFAILFGLSMDYEVFLLSRVREEYLRTRDSHSSVVGGLSATARVITSAALIMISVFATFLLTNDIEIKMFAVGLSVAVLVDATVVRMVLVPATMALMGDANWWLPGWLDRLLPHVDVEGSHVLTPTPAHAFTRLDPGFIDELDELELVG